MTFRFPALARAFPLVLVCLVPAAVAAEPRKVTIDDFDAIRSIGSPAVSTDGRHLRGRARGRTPARGNDVILESLRRTRRSLTRDIYQRYMPERTFSKMGTHPTAPWPPA